MYFKDSYYLGISFMKNENQQGLREINHAMQQAV
jgi:hypothetical protein